MRTIFLLLIAFQSFGQQQPKVLMSYKEFVTLTIPIKDGTSYKYSIPTDTARFFEPGTDIYDAVITFKKRGGPVVIPPTNQVIEKVDGEKATFTSEWYHGTTNANWYLKTIAFSNVAGSSFTYTFTGTKIDIFAELLPSHGTGTITLDTNPTVTVSFKGEPKLPALIYSSPDMADVKHTIKLTVTAGYCLLDYFVISHPVGWIPPVIVPPVVVPPSQGSIINVAPGTNTIGTAVRMAAPGWTIVPANGSYNEADFSLPIGVSIQGQSKDGVIINCTTKKTYPADDPLKNGLIQIRSDNSTNGNQTVSNLTIKGNNNAIGAILVNNRNNVTVQDIYMENCNFYGLWAYYADNLKVYRVKTFNTSWCSASFASGEICLAELSNFLFEDVEMTSNSPTRGYGLKFIWGNYNENGVTKYRSLYSGTFRNVRPKMNHSSNWANGVSYNIGIELHDVIVKGNILFENCDFGNQVSMHSPVCSNFEVVFRNCTGNLANDRYVVEWIMCGIKMYNCTFTNASRFFFNGQPNLKTQNIYVEACSFDQGTAPTLDAVNLVGKNGTVNVVFKNNKIRKRSANPEVKYQSPPNIGVSIDNTNTIVNF